MDWHSKAISIFQPYLTQEAYQLGPHNKSKTKPIPPPTKVVQSIIEPRQAASLLYHKLHIDFKTL